MSLVGVGGREYQVDVFVFDKDGLLFQSRPFWRELARARIESLEEHLAPPALLDWLRLTGLAAERREGRWAVTEVAVGGPLALASPDEEITITAACLCRAGARPWDEARELAREVFAQSDRRFQLETALTPRRGFPEIFRRLRAHGIPYGLATSDDHSRAVRSVNLYDRAEDLAFILTPREVRRGKPAPDMLEAVAERMAVPPARLAMVGDSVVDVRMARAAGALGIGVPESEAAAEAMRPYADEIVSSLDEIVVLRP